MLSGRYVFYFIGMVNNRIGSLIVQPILIKTKFVTFAPYKDYLECELKDSKVTLLNQENNIFRSYIAIFLSLVILYVYIHLELIINWIKSIDILLLIIIGLIVFLFSYRKQTSYIRKRVININTLNNHSNGNKKI